MFSFREPSWVIRKIPSAKDTIFLSFDDGPNSDTTPQVLDLLKKYNAQATFFVIGKKADSHSELIQKMKSDGHCILSHSIDHDYRNYFKSVASLEIWLKKSTEHLQRISNQSQFGFRPPAGVLNPPLLKAAHHLQLPMILWSQRYFDSTLKLTKNKILRSIQRIQAGDIILLHDQQKQKNRASFLEALEELIIQLQKKEFKLRALNQSQIVFRDASL